MSEFITVRIPRDCWNQLIDDYENMCGTSAKHIEILQDAFVVEDVKPKKKKKKKANDDDKWIEETNRLQEEHDKFVYRFPDFEG
jgi:hypothetical protein